MEYNILKGELKKAIRLANKVNNCTDATVTGYSWSRDKEFPEFIDVTCEICHDYKTRADYDVKLSVFIPDRRRSYAYTFIDGHYITDKDFRR